MDFSRKILFLLTCAYVVLLPLIPQEVKFKGVAFNDLIFVMFGFV